MPDHVISLDGLLPEPVVDVSGYPELKPALEKFISSLTFDVLKRQPTHDEMKSWLSLMLRGMSRKALALHLLYLAERRKNVAKNHYLTLLCREPSEEVLSFLGSLLASGKTMEDMLAAILNSAEYQALHGSTNEQYIASLFRNLLLKKAEETEMNAWIGLLNSHSATRMCVAHQILTGDEYRELCIRGWYRKYTSHEPEPHNLQHWLNELKKGKKREEVLASILSTDSYFSSSITRTGF